MVAFPFSIPADDLLWSVFFFNTAHYLVCFESFHCIFVLLLCSASALRLQEVLSRQIIVCSYCPYLSNLSELEAVQL